MTSAANSLGLLLLDPMFIFILFETGFLYIALGVLKLWTGLEFMSSTCLCLSSAEIKVCTTTIRFLIFFCFVF